MHNPSYTVVGVWFVPQWLTSSKLGAQCADVERQWDPQEAEPRGRKGVTGAVSSEAISAGLAGATESLQWIFTGDENLPSSASVIPHVGAH